MRATLSVPFYSPQKMVTALGTHWHPEHFCCVSCGEPFGDEGESLTPTLKAAGPLDIPPCSLWASALRPPKSSGPRIFSCSLLAPTCPTCVFPSHPFPLCPRPQTPCLSAYRLPWPHSLRSCGASGATSHPFPSSYSVPAPRFPRAGGPPLLPPRLPAALRPALPGLPRPHSG